MNIKALFLVTMLAALLLATPVARAQDDDAAAAPPAEDGFKFTKYYMDFLINDDATEDDTFTVGLKILREDAIESAKQYSITYSTSAQRVDVLEAYTLKPDGKRLDVRKDNFQLTVSGGKGSAAPAFSDETTLTIVFPDVEVGDTLSLVYKQKVTDPLFPKQFSHLINFPRDTIYDDARVSYSIPLSLQARFKNLGMTETANHMEKGRRLLAWSFKNPVADKHNAHSVTPVEHVDDDPGVTVSTFASFRDIAESYGARAAPKAAVTDHIQKLADTLAEGQKTTRDKVQAIYEWVAKNITYAGNCIGIGAVVPRDLDFVLANKMGDCKDHATLLQALLAAEHIKSTQALIGVNRIFDLPEIPVVNIINHVINYVPELDMYLDSTSRLPFGILSESLAGKPVLLVDGYKDGTRTPVPPPGLNKRIQTGKIRISEDGTAEGTLAVVITGLAGYDAHMGMGQSSKGRLERMDERLLSSSGYEGSVETFPGKWDEDTLTYTYAIHFLLKDFIFPGSPGALHYSPPFAHKGISALVKEAMAERENRRKEKLTSDFVCSNGLIEENYTYEFPKNINILAIPDDVTVSTPVQTYTATYKRDGQTVTTTHKFDDTTPGPTCAPAIEDQYEQVAVKAWRDMKAQIVYK